MDKIMPFVEAFAGLLKALLGNLLGNKLEAKLGKYETYEGPINELVAAAKEAFKD